MLGSGGFWRGILATIASFKYIQPDNGTTPTATVSNDTLTLTSSDSSITITGNSATKTIDLVVSGSGAYTEITEVPVGVRNGVNVTFTISFTPVDPANRFKLYQNGVYFRQGLNYTIAGTTITMAAPPESDQNLDVNYFY